MRVHLRALGCRLNEAELQQWSRGFAAAGHDLTDAVEQADWIVLNTCAVTGEAGRRSRQLIRRAQRANPDARIAVSGCYSSLEPDVVAAQAGVDLVVPNSEKDRLVDLALRAFVDAPAPLARALQSAAAPYPRTRTRAFVKVQDGCRYRCTFCTVTLARGAERSRAPAELIDEINAAVAAGVLEVVLTGVHLGGYQSQRIDLAGLVQRILSETDIARLRLGSVEPWDIPDRLYATLENPRFMPHLHLPLQHGTDGLLRRMGRRTRTKAFRELAARLREARSGLALSTDLIVGFPGETAALAEQSQAFVESIGFDDLHVFPFSPRTGTAAADFPERVEPDIRRARLRALTALAASLRSAARTRAIGASFDVLWEGHRTTTADGEVWITGLAPNYLRCALRLPAADAARRLRTLERVRGVISDDGADRLIVQPISIPDAP